MPIYKNAARTVAFQSLTTAGMANTTTTPTVTISIDGASPNAATNSPVHVGGGAWRVALTAAELNGDLVIMTATATGCVPSQREVYPEADYTSARAVAITTIATGVAAIQTSIAVGQNTGYVNDATPSAIEFTVAGDAATKGLVANKWINQLLLFTSGDNEGVPRKITAFNATTKVVTVDAFPASPADEDSFTILGLIPAAS